MKECRCPDFAKGDDVCVEGTIYSYCSSKHCGGGCEDVGSCGCRCHKSHTKDCEIDCRFKHGMHCDCPCHLTPEQNGARECVCGHSLSIHWYGIRLNESSNEPCKICPCRNFLEKKS